MSNINLSGLDELNKEEKYKTVILQIVSLISAEKNFIANISNIVGALKSVFEHYNWVGFYFKDKEFSDELVLGPFQGKVACTRLKTGKGVCGTAVERKETIIVDNVNDFPGHIFCDPNSRSEIVVPVVKDSKVIAVLDVDSDSYSAFDSTDKNFLEELILKISYIF